MTRKTCIALFIAGVSLTASKALAQLSDGDFDGLTVGTNPDCGNNAGAGAAWEEYQPDVFDYTVHVLLNGVYRLSSALSSSLERSQRPGGAAIINISSSSSFLAVETSPAYGAAKAGLNGLTRNLAVAWGKKNIRVNAIAPGLTRTRMTDAAFQMEDVTSPAMSRTPLQRLAEPGEMAGAVLFLSSTAAGFITGQVLSVDGGFTVTG